MKSNAFGVAPKKPRGYAEGLLLALLTSAVIKTYWLGNHK